MNVFLKIYGLLVFPLWGVGSQHGLQGTRGHCCSVCWIKTTGSLVVVTLWNITFQAPLSIRFFRQEYCSGLLGRISSVQSISRVRLFATPWIAAHQASLSITNSRMFIVMLSKAHLTSHSRMSGFRSVITPSWLSGSTPSPAFIVCRLCDEGHSDQCEVIPHCSHLKGFCVPRSLR